MVFTQTRLLSVKVATLVTFLSMVQILDQVKRMFLICAFRFCSPRLDESDTKPRSSSFEDSYKGAICDGIPRITTSLLPAVS